MWQVCALQWNTHEKEILSSHGFSQNQLCLWKYPSMAKVSTIAMSDRRFKSLKNAVDMYTQFQGLIALTCMPLVLFLIQFVDSEFYSRNSWEIKIKSLYPFP